MAPIAATVTGLKVASAVRCGSIRSPPTFDATATAIGTAGSDHLRRCSVTSQATMGSGGARGNRARRLRHVERVWHDRLRRLLGRLRFCGSGII